MYDCVCVSGATQVTPHKHTHKCRLEVAPKKLAHASLPTFVITSFLGATSSIHPRKYRRWPVDALKGSYMFYDLFSWFFAFESCPSSICVFCVHPAPPLLVLKSLSLPAADKASKSAFLGGSTLPPVKCAGSFGLMPQEICNRLLFPGVELLPELRCPRATFLSLMVCCCLVARATKQQQNHECSSYVFLVCYKSLRQTKQTPLCIV